MTISLNDPVRIMNVIAERSRSKHRYLQIGLVLLSIGIILIPVCIGAGLFHGSERVQFVIAEDKKPVVENCSIAFENGSLVTSPLLVTSQNAQKYIVLLNNGDSVDIDETWVRAVIIKKE